MPTFIHGKVSVCLLVQYRVNELWRVFFHLLLASCDQDLPGDISISILHSTKRHYFLACCPWTGFETVV